MSVTLCVMLWATPGRRQQLAEYEDLVLGRLAPHGARLLTRVSSLEGGPTEVQVLEFPSEDALEEFQSDPHRLALTGLRAEAIARTEILRVTVVNTSPPPSSAAAGPAVPSAHRTVADAIRDCDGV